VEQILNQIIQGKVVRCASGEYMMKEQGSSNKLKILVVGAWFIGAGLLCLISTQYLQKWITQTIGIILMILVLLSCMSAQALIQARVTNDN